MSTNSSGTVVGEQGHFPYGESWYLNNSTTKWEFTTYERDAESGNDYAQARYNANRLGRFSSPDPLAGSITDPQSLNRYSYARDMPVMLNDPTGMSGSGPLGCLSAGNQRDETTGEGAYMPPGSGPYADADPDPTPQSISCHALPGAGSDEAITIIDSEFTPDQLGIPVLNYTFFGTPWGSSGSGLGPSLTQTSFAALELSDFGDESGSSYYQGDQTVWMSFYGYLGFGPNGGAYSNLIAAIKKIIKGKPDCADLFGGEGAANELLDNMNLQQVPPTEAPSNPTSLGAWQLVAANNLTGGAAGNPAETAWFGTTAGNAVVWNGSTYQTYVGSVFANYSGDVQTAMLMHEMSHPLTGYGSSYGINPSNGIGIMEQDYIPYSVTNLLNNCVH